MTRPVAAVPPHRLPPHRDRRRPPAGPSPHSPGEREPADRLRAPGTGRSFGPVRRGGGGHGAGRRPPSAPPDPGGSAVRGAGRPSGRFPRGRDLRWDSAWRGAGVYGVARGKGGARREVGNTDRSWDVFSFTARADGCAERERFTGCSGCQQGMCRGWGCAGGSATPTGCGILSSAWLWGLRQLCRCRDARGGHSVAAILLFSAAHHMPTPEIALIRGR